MSEFVSDAFDSAAINHEDLRKEMEQLVLDKKDDTPSPDGQLILQFVTPLILLHNYVLLLYFGSALKHNNTNM